MASGQLSVHGNASVAFSSGDEMVAPPPAYSNHFQQQQQNQQSQQQQISQPIRQQQPMTTSTSSQLQKFITAQSHHQPSSTAHPLLDGASGSTDSAAYAIGNVPSQSPKETNVGGQRMSL